MKRFTIVSWALGIFFLIVSCSNQEYVEPDAATEVAGTYRGVYQEVGKNPVIGVDVEVKRLEKNKISITRANSANTVTPEFELMIKKLVSGVTNVDGTYTVSFDLGKPGVPTKLSFNDADMKKIYLKGSRISEIPDITKDVVGTYRGTFIKGGTVQDNVTVIVTKKPNSNTMVMISPAQGKTFPALFEVDLFKIGPEHGFNFNQLRQALVESRKVSITFDLDVKTLHYTNYSAGGEGFTGKKI